MDNKDKKGFSGLSDLASEVSINDETIKPKHNTEAKPSEPRQLQHPQREADTSEIEWKTTSSSRPIEAVNSEKSSGGSSGKWTLGIIFVFFVILFINGKDQSNTSPIYSPPSSSQSKSNTPNRPSPAVETPIKTQSTGLQYIKPSVGTNNVLSVAEIRWCIREDIRIEAMRDVIDNNAGIDEFNRFVKDYNSRCSSYRYREGSQSRAERDVEAYRSQIISETIREARQLGRSSSSVSKGASTSSIPKKPNSQYTREAQQLLTDLGYEPGPVDGDYGRRTADAVKIFQRNAGITQDGWIDEGLLSALRRAKAANKSPTESKIKPQPQTNLQSRHTNSSPAPTTAISYFTRGSHKDEVWRLQGPPTDINVYSSTETWWYGSSRVQISKANSRVLSWSNNGNLKVRYLPGSNTTTAQYFTRGSHKDEVLRLQGTPSNIDIYTYTETLWYGSSRIQISNTNDRVLTWSNSGNLKVRYLPGSNTTTALYFTRGSHKDEVLRLQGTPTNIDIYTSTETWWFGSSRVQISKSDDRVLSWSNNGNLKVI